MVMAAPVAHPSPLTFPPHFTPLPMRASSEPDYQRPAASSPYDHTSDASSRADNDTGDNPSTLSSRATTLGFAVARGWQDSCKAKNLNPTFLSHQRPGSATSQSFVPWRPVPPAFDDWGSHLERGNVTARERDDTTDLPTHRHPRHYLPPKPREREVGFYSSSTPRLPIIPNQHVQSKTTSLPFPTHKLGEIDGPFRAESFAIVNTMPASPGTEIEAPAHPKLEPTRVPSITESQASTLVARFLALRGPGQERQNLATHVPSQQTVPRPGGIEYLNRKSMQRGLFHVRLSGSSYDGPPTSSSSSPSSSSASEHLSSDSDAFSQENTLMYRNARPFPPRLPASLVRASSVSHVQASFSKHVSSWVARHARSSDFGGSPHDTTSTLALDSIQSDESSPVHSSGTSTGGDVERLWKLLEEKRRKNHLTKVEMGRLRGQLRAARGRVDQADNAFMAFVRPLLVRQRGFSNASRDTLNRLVADMHAVRNVYRPLELSYEVLENRMDDEEQVLYILEMRFYSLLAAGQSKPGRQIDPEGKKQAHDAPRSTDVPDELLGISPDGPTEGLHPTYLKLVSAIGDLKNAKEAQQDLVLTKQHYDDDPGLRLAPGGKRARAKEEFMEDFAMEMARLNDTVSNLERLVRNLRQQCEEKGVMRKHLSAGMEYILNPGTIFEDMDLDETDRTYGDKKSLAHANFPDLLSQPDHVLANPEPLTPLGALRAATKLPNNEPNKHIAMQRAKKEYAIDQLVKDFMPDDKGDFVNRWLLYNLQQSPLLVVLLYSIFFTQSSLQIKDSRRWQHDVLYYWWRDGTFITNEATSASWTSSYETMLPRPEPPPFSRAISENDMSMKFRLHVME
ncbi:hypothetical protein S40285_08940 [Stachybotrys chlorohalonatus IBT 40285]|uniref:Uncharacterized protein n=1 Tax=Stachybotrys chlorohalonatus (strain IBT 40285) TaxID=1283841 RepID=A0A084QC42_STAC4|nr:hypothetical protein S40285_08940 [Stachybotrys chlorohalonata IBT 40285]